MSIVYLVVGLVLRVINRPVSSQLCPSGGDGHLEALPCLNDEKEVSL